jgi:hypothetical protein
MNGTVLTLGAVIGAGIAYFQWRTAHQRVILDLFDRRMAAYERLKPPIIHALRHGVVDPEQFSEFARAVQGAKFFFGKDVTDYLEQVAEDLAQFETLSSRQDRLTVERGESRAPETAGAHLHRQTFD